MNNRDDLQVVEDDIAILEPTESTNWIRATMTHKEKRTWDRQNLFLETYAETGSIRASQPICRVSRSSVYYWDQGDVFGFSDRFDKSKHEFREKIQDMIWERCKNPEGNRGSDVLLLAMMNSHHPEKWRANKDLGSDIGSIVRTLDELKSLRKKEKETMEHNDT